MKCGLKKIHVYIFLVFVCSCQSCFKEYPDNGSLIFREYDFVAGVVPPDSTAEFKRTYKTEVFVGKMIPAADNNIYTIEGVLDPVLYNLLYDTRQHYRVYYEFDPSAMVYIKSGTDSVQLTYSDHGIYRDQNGTLSIKSGIDYQLIVKRLNGEVFTSSTKVPNEIHIFEPSEDTFRVVPRLYGVTWAIDTNNVKISFTGRPAYFVMVDKRSNFREIYFYSVSGTDLRQAIFFQASDIDTTKINFVDVQIEIRGVDSNFALFNQPSNFSAPDDFWKSWYRKLEDLPIRQRSNILGSNDVVGVFGSYNAASKHFTAMALWDSVQAGKAGEFSKK
jgi:hypothetical protein